MRVPPTRLIMKNSMPMNTAPPKSGCTSMTMHRRLVTTTGGMNPTLKDFTRACLLE